MKKILLFTLFACSISLYGQTVKISALPAATTINAADLYVIVQSGATKRITNAILVAQMKAARDSIAALGTGKVAIADSGVYNKGYVTPTALDEAISGIEVPEGALEAADSGVYNGGYVTPTALDLAISGVEGGTTDTTSLSTRINLKADKASPTFTGTVVLPTTTSIGDVSSTEIGYVNNVSSAIQTQLNARLLRADSVNYANGYMSRYDGVIGLAGKANIADSVAKWVTKTQLDAAIDGITGADFTDGGGSLTLSGADAVTLTTTNTTSVTLPTSGTLATTANVASMIGDTMTARLAGADIGIALADSGEYNGGYITPTGLNTILEEYTPGNFDTTYLHFRIDSLALVVDSLSNVVSEQESAISSIWDAIAQLGDFDLVAPRYESGEVGTYDPKVLVMIMDSTDLDQDSIPATTAFNFTASDVTIDATDVTINEDTVFITLEAVPQVWETLLLDYTKPATDGLQDTAGNKTATFTNKTVTNNGSAFVFESAEIGTTTDSIIVLVMNRVMNEDSIPAVTDFDVTEDAATLTVEAVTLSNDTAYIELDAAVTGGTEILISYTRNEELLQDTTGYEAASWADSTVTNNVEEPAANMLSNGTFDSGTGWTLSADNSQGLAISGGSLNWTDAAGNDNSSATQATGSMNTVIESNTAYTLTFDVSGNTVYIRFLTNDGLSTLVGFAEYAVGSRSVNFTSPAEVYSGSFRVLFGYSTYGNASIDNITLNPQ